MEHIPHNTRKKNGFTIIETFVAISVLLAAVAGPLVLVTRGLQSATLAKQRLTASFLALEGIELVRHKRDSNLLAGVNLTTGFSQCISAVCHVDVPGNVLAAPCASNCLVQKDISTGEYSQGKSGGNWKDIEFTRQLTITDVNNLGINDEEFKVEVTVTWPSGALGGTQKVIINDYLFNLK